MFTGIVEAVGRISHACAEDGARRIRIGADLAAELAIGQSIAVNGVCLSVVSATEQEFEVVAVEETLRKSTLDALQAGTPVNLERAMRLHDRLDGHLVLGHVDTTASVSRLRSARGSRLYRVQLGEAQMQYVIPTGSIALDGISLTVARMDESGIAVSIIPHTYEHTACSTWVAHRHVNVEFDAVGKYVARHMERSGTLFH